MSRSGPIRMEFRMQILNSFSGVREAFNPYAVLELSPVLASGAEPGEVRIRGLETGLYVALDAQVCLITKSLFLLLHVELHEVEVQCISRSKGRIISILQETRTPFMVLR